MSEAFDVLVIGGGPVGGYAAQKVAETGRSVAILEEHREIGEPVQCGGIFTPRVLEMVDARSTVLTEIQGCEFYSPSGQELVVDGGETEAVVVDRVAFDREVVKGALKAGATAFLGTLATGVERQGKELVVHTRGNDGMEQVRCRVLIGADGVKGNVTAWFGLGRPYRILPGFEADVVGAEYTRGYVKVFTGQAVAPGFFAWLVPGDPSARAGLCLGQGNARPYLDRMFTDGPPARFLAEAQTLGYIIGGIPIGVAKRTYTDGVMIAGDAAFQAKATSGGGIFTGLVCAEACARTAVEALDAGDTSASFLSRYERRWKEAIGRELNLYLYLHRAFVKLNDAQLENLFVLLQNPRLLRIVNEQGDIDYPGRAILALLKEEPRLLKFVGPAVRAVF
ncbi:MAG: NAD(P)/FAD-dependent oxidoreductase [Thermoplasmata archaeon]|nr:NAD(P)/FAD-dependent oxidoreductase [Thermoplasmata archaeon]